MTMGLGKYTAMTAQNHFILFDKNSKPFHKKGRHFRPFHFGFEMVLALKKLHFRYHFTPFHKHKAKLKIKLSPKKMYIHMSEGLFFLTAESKLKLTTIMTGTKVTSYDEEVMLKTKLKTKSKIILNTLRAHPVTNLRQIQSTECPANDRIKLSYVTLLDILPKGSPPLRKHNKFYATLGRYDLQRNSEQIRPPYF